MGMFWSGFPLPVMFVFWIVDMASGLCSRTLTKHNHHNKTLTPTPNKAVDAAYLASLQNMTRLALGNITRKEHIQAYNLFHPIVTKYLWDWILVPFYSAKTHWVHANENKSAAPSHDSTLCGRWQHQCLFLRLSVWCVLHSTLIDETEYVSRHCWVLTP